MRKLAWLVALLLLAVGADAQEFIRYFPPTIPQTSGGSSFLSGGIGLGGTVASPYANLYGDAANTLALRNGTAAQTFNVYSSFTDASNYSRLTIKANDTNGNYVLTAEKAGSGALGYLSMGGFSATYIGTNWVASSSDAYELGASGTLWRHGFFSRSIQGSKIKALTAATPTAAWDCAIAAGARTGGTLDYCVYGADATDYQYRCGAIKFAAVNKAGTTTCTMAPAAPDQTNDGNAGAITSSTLTYAITCTDTTDSFSLLFNAASGLAETTLQVESRLNLMNPATCTPQ